MIKKELRIAPPPAKSTKISNLNGFTLAEVLITLGIIGVVAAMTMPSIIANYRIKQTVTQLKKINSTLQNAFIYMKEIDFGGTEAENWGVMTEDEFNRKFAKNLNVTEICDKKDSAKCFNNINYKNLNGAENMLTFRGMPGIILNDGSVLAIGSYFETNPDHIATTGTYGQIFIDINGSKSPNVLGRDVFSFFILKDRVVARGTGNQKLSENYCSAFKSSIGHNGLGCTAWVIYNENMDYLKCDDLS